MIPADPAATQRLDMWLWCARIRRQRAACSALVRQGAVRVNARPTDKPDTKLRAGDVLTLGLDGKVIVLRICALGQRRGDAQTAQTLYTIVPEAG